MSEHYHIVTKTDCSWCDKAVDLIEKSGGTYSLYLYENLGPPTWPVLFMKTHGFKTVPQIFDKDFNLIGGYEELDGYLNGNYKS